MCGRIALAASIGEIVREFHVDDVAVEEVGPRYNVAPSQRVLAVAESSDGTRRRLGSFRWGLVPHWADHPSIGNRLINARVETADTAPAFRSAFATRRCLIPASGYYEWQAPRRSTGPGRRPHKVPYYFRRRDGMLVALGGLWEVWHGPNDAVLRTCTVLTTDSNTTNRPVHDRMPVVVPEALWERWLAREPLAENVRAAVGTPAPDDLLVAERISEKVNDPRNEGPELVEPLVG